MASLYLVDAPGYLYKAYHAIRNMTNSRGESTNALFGFIRSLLKLIKDYSPTHLAVVFDGPHHIKKRVALYADYKATRKEMPKDLSYQIQWAREFCELLGLPVLSIPEVEADDTLASITVWATQHGIDVILCSSDKDLCQLVGEHVVLLQTHKDNFIVDSAKVEEIYGVPPGLIGDWLALTGDASDNVPGVEGFGAKTAAALLKEFGSLEELLNRAEEITAKSKREALLRQKEQALLSRRLVTLDTEVPFPREKSFFALKPANDEGLKQLYIKMNFTSLLRDLVSTTPQTTTVQDPSYILVDDEASLSVLVQRLREQEEVAFDTETTALHPMKADLVGLGFCTEEGKASYVPVNGKLGLDKVLQAFKPLFEEGKVGFYGHNVKYDLHVLENYGIHVAKLSFDTMVASYLLHSHSRQHSLDALSLQYFGKSKISTESLIGKGKKAITMAEVEIDKVCNYCCEDVDYTYRLHKILSGELKKRQLSSLFYDLELPLIPVLLRMERNGIFVDVDRLQRMGRLLNEQAEALAREVHVMAGQSFNLNSPRQVSEVLFTRLGIRPPKKTATGLSTSAEVLESLEKAYPIAGKILEYRMLEKLRSGYVEALPTEVFAKTGRIHCSFNQSVAATGRLSCQDPNLQNIPVRTEAGRRVREAFRPQQTGWSFLGADYSQIELRLLAHLSADPGLIKAFQQGEDVHRFTASEVFGVPLEQVTKEQRGQAKVVNFGIIYGQQAFGLSQELNISLQEASRFIQRYFERYPRVQAYLEEIKEKARRTDKAVTMMGREREIPEINSRNMALRSTAERLAINTPLQGSAADLIKKAMLAIDRRLTGSRLDAKMILQIHDELIFEVRDEDAQELSQLVREEMESVELLKVPLIVDIAMGKSWMEC